MAEHSRQALVGAIGGTYISLAVADIDELTISNFALLNTADFEQPMQAVERYLASIPRCPNKVGLAVAATVLGDKAEFAHRDWVLTRNDVRAATGADHVSMINDFDALALSLPSLSKYDLHELNAGHAVPYATKAVIGAGTGLGVAGLVRAGDTWTVVGGEGGYMSFPAPTAGEFDVRSVFPPGSFVSYDDVFSGRGLVAVYNGLRAEVNEPPKQLGARAIATAGLSREDPLAARSLELMATWLGRFAGDIALLYGARGGLYLAGGLVANTIPALETGHFRAGFESKGGHSAYLAEIPVRVIKTAADAGLRGAAIALANTLPATPAVTKRTTSKAS